MADRGIQKIKAFFGGLSRFLFKNTSARQTVAKNTVWLSVSNFGGRLIKAAVIIYAARILGTAQWGAFSYALTLAGFFTLFVDPGVNALLVRESARAEEAHRVTLLSTTFYLKLALLVGGVLAVLFIAPAFSTLPGAKALLPIVALIIIGDTLREFFSSFIRAKEKMEWEAGIFLFTNVCIVVLGFVFLFNAPTALAFGWAYASATALGAIAALWVLRPYAKKIFTHFSAALIGPIFRSSWPFAVTGALGVLLTSADVLIISWMRTASEVGIYSAAIRIIQLLYLLPVVIQYSVLPVLSRYAARDPERFRAAFERTIAIVFAISVPIALGGVVLGTEIMKVVFGIPYAFGGISLSILMFTMIIDYPGTIISSAIFAYDHQKSLIIASAIGGISNIVLDILLISKFGIAGSAAATLFAQLLVSAYLWRTLKKLNYFTILPRLKKIAVSGVLIASASAGLLYLNVSIFIIVPACAALYFFLLIAMREPLLGEIFRILRPIEKTIEREAPETV